MNVEHIAEKMVDNLSDHAEKCGVELNGINRHNFNTELDDRFNDGGEARCEYFADLGWEYAQEFGEFGSDDSETALWRVLSSALELLEGRFPESEE